jgi:cytochrome c peroxidase
MEHLLLPLKPFKRVLLATLAIVMLTGLGFGEDALKLPDWVPRPLTPTNNALTSAKIDLGRHLFYDTRLSLDQTMSCASCHVQAKAFSDGKQTSKGVTGEATHRNSMSLANVAYMPVLTWANPNLTSLEIQALLPLFGEHPVEMGMAGKETLLFSRIQQDPTYQTLFRAAFPREAQKTNEELYNITTLTQALASFQRSLISLSSPYDAYKYGGKPHAITAAAKRGESLFFGEKLECYHCHGGFNFNDNVGHVRTPFPELGFHNTGLFNLNGKGLYPETNQGIFEFTSDQDDMGKFRTPSLRNVEVTSPYMHDGSMMDLRSVIKDHYAVAGRSSLSAGGSNPLRSPFIRGFEISEEEINDLIEFLKALTDKEFLHDPKHANPWPKNQAHKNELVRAKGSAREDRATSK